LLLARKRLRQIIDPARGWNLVEERPPPQPRRPIGGLISPYNGSTSGMSKGARASMFDGADALVLARLQFAFTISFHFIFPAFSIGLASYLAVLEALWLKTGKALYLDLFKYWLKIFAIAFAMGVVSGIVMSYQFGTNWSVFSDRAGPVIGPLMAYEVLTAFFLEAGFLGVMLFGMDKVGKTLHFAATCMVALGTAISAFWILSVNSWMQTPVGFEMGANGQFLPGPSWWAIVFNPSFPYRLVHTVIAAYLTTAMVVGGAGAWHLLRNRENRHARKMFSMAMWMAALVAPVQIFAGDMHGLNTLEHQPAKVMAMEGHFESHPEGAPLILFGIPNAEEKRVDYAIKIPGLSSLILAHEWGAPLVGLDTIPDDEEPPVWIVFWSFRIMVAIGFAMLALGLWSMIARWRGKLYQWPWLHRAALVMGPSGFVAVIAGWVTTEVGRQPWVIYGLLRTAEARSPLDAPAVAASLIAFVIVYFAVFGVGTWYILRLMSAPPHPHETGVEGAPIRTAGITPGPTQNPTGGERLPASEEGA
jgi:cytochrome d ubiquinol oxidase subunit I